MKRKQGRPPILTEENKSDIILNYKVIGASKTVKLLMKSNKKLKPHVIYHFARKMGLTKKKGTGKKSTVIEGNFDLKEYCKTATI